MRRPAPFRSRPKLTVLTALVAALGLVLPSSAASATSLTYSSKPLIEFVSSGVPGNPFWGAVETGAEQAAKDQGVSFEYLAPQSSSDQIIEEEQLLKAAISRHPAGIAVNDQFPAALDPLVKQAIKSGIAIDIVNAGLSSWKTDGAIDFIGQDDYDGGLAAGVAMAKAGVKVGACTYDPVEARRRSALHRFCHGHEGGWAQRDQHRSQSAGAHRPVLRGQWPGGLPQGQPVGRWARGHRHRLL